MAVEIKQLGIGDLSGTTSEALYAVPTGKTAVIKSMRLTNTYGGAITVSITLTHGSEVRKVLPASMTVPQGYSFVDDSELTLEAGDTLNAVLGATGQTADFILSGIEREVV